MRKRFEITKHGYTFRYNTQDELRSYDRFSKEIALYYNNLKELKNLARLNRKNPECSISKRIVDVQASIREFVENPDMADFI